MRVVHKTMVAVCVSLLLCSRIAGQRLADARDVADATVVARVGDYVQSYFSVARTIVAREVVTLQPLAENLGHEGRARRLEYEMRVEWEPLVGGAAPVATIHRQLLTVDGRPPRRGENDECLSPASPEPLGFLLPDARGAFAFTAPAATRNGRQRGLAIDYVPRVRGVPSLEWRGDCASFDLPGLVRGRVTVDPQTFAVLRLDQRLIRDVDIPVPRHQRRDGWGDSITVERADSLIRYEPIEFHDPRETLRLPVEIRHVTVVRTPMVRRLRTVQRFSAYRRFVTTVRVHPVP
jgi:hypothetical protein